MSMIYFNSKAINELYLEKLASCTLLTNSHKHEYRANLIAHTYSTHLLKSERELY